MRASVIVVLVGLPGVGKTTFSKYCKTHLQKYKVTIFHYDELCKTFSTHERKSVLNDVESFILNFQSETKTCIQIVIIDDNNYYKSMRDEYMKICKRLKLGFLVVYFDVVSLEDVLAKNLCRHANQQVPNNIITEMFNKLEVPRNEKNVHVVHVNVGQLCDGTEYEFDLFQKKIAETSLNPLMFEEPHAVVSMPQSQLQRVDLALRKIVHMKIQDNKTKALRLNALKKKLFSKISRKEIVLSSLDRSSHSDGSDFHRELAKELELHFASSDIANCET